MKITIYLKFRKVVFVMMKIFLTNLGKYNEGELIGEWVELPVSQEELQEVFKHIGSMKNTKNIS